MGRCSRAAIRGRSIDVLQPESDLAVKLLLEYLERAVQLEGLAAGEQNLGFRQQVLDQAAAYRKIAAKRARDYGLPLPSQPELPRTPSDETGA